MAKELTQPLEEFVAFARTLRGDEKSEAQTFLDHFFRALGHAGAIEAGATFEFRVAKKPGSAHDQAFDYWTHIVPKRPPYVILCNFDEFWIYDFNIQLFDPRGLTTCGKAASYRSPACASSNSSKVS